MNIRIGNFRINRRRGGCISGVLGCGFTLFVIAFIGVIFALVFGLIKSSDAYEIAMSELRQNEQAIAILGEPIEEGFFTSGSINTSGSSGQADLSIPVSGPKGKGKVFVLATKSMGQWEINQLVLEVNNERINLLTGR